MSSDQIERVGSQPQREVEPQQVAVGVIATEDNTENALRTLVRAQERGHNIFVLQPGESETETTRFARQFDVDIVETSATGDLERYKEELAIAASVRDFESIIVPSPDCERIIYDETLKTIDEDSMQLDPVTERTAERADDIIVGIPAYNEEVAIGSTVVKSRQFADSVVVVDDGSTDATVKVAQDAGARVVELETNSGKGKAIQTLLSTVERDYDIYEALVLIDGDGQHDPSEIPHVAEPVCNGEADLALGSRYVDEGSGSETPLHRRFGQKVLDVLTLGSSHTKVSDSQSGFRALSPTAVEQLDVSTDGYGVESEMIERSVSEDLHITEQPISVRYEGVDGQTENPLRHGLSVVVFLLSLIRDRHPLLFFSLPGAVLVTVGALYGIDGILIYQESGSFYPAKALVSGFVMILGTLSVFTGLILNSVSNMLEAQR
ncbi:glycosyltransferase family 2 protein [Halosimplex sp. TS25]|uniref:glycosyltransferase family 2 protein n=1 Tax=Halosimplex rarum TaxID=3396619 RepID=UPI0039E9D005